MLKITIPSIERYNEETNEFSSTKEQVLQLEHSLTSLSKWESKWQKPFLDNKQKSFEETIDYIRCMTITQNVDPDIYTNITSENITQVNEYIKMPMTATILPKSNDVINKETPTSELIYYWMISFNIPFECQKWHLNKLITLINVCNIKNKPPKKTNRKELMSRNAALNAARRKSLNTRG